MRIIYLLFMRLKKNILQVLNLFHIKKKTAMIKIIICCVVTYIWPFFLNLVYSLYLNYIFLYPSWNSIFTEVFMFFLILLSQADWLIWFCDLILEIKVGVPNLILEFNSFINQFIKNIDFLTLYLFEPDFFRRCIIILSLFIDACRDEICNTDIFIRIKDFIETWIDDEEDFLYYLFDHLKIFFILFRDFFFYCIMICFSFLCTLNELFFFFLEKLLDISITILEYVSYSVLFFLQFLYESILLLITYILDIIYFFFEKAFELIYFLIKTIFNLFLFFLKFLINLIRFCRSITCHYNEKKKTIIIFIKNSKIENEENNNHELNANEETNSSEINDNVQKTDNKVNQGEIIEKPQYRGYVDAIFGKEAHDFLVCTNDEKNEDSIKNIAAEPKITESDIIKSEEIVEKPQYRGYVDAIFGKEVHDFLMRTNDEKKNENSIKNTVIESKILEDAKANQEKTVEQPQYRGYVDALFGKEAHDFLVRTNDEKNEDSIKNIAAEPKITESDIIKSEEIIEKPQYRGYVDAVFGKEAHDFLVRTNDEKKKNLNSEKTQSSENSSINSVVETIIIIPSSEKEEKVDFSNE